VAGRSAAKTRPARRPKRASRGRRRLRALWLVAFVGVVAYLYYQPLTSYLETRGELAAERAKVETLAVTKAELELRLVNSTSLEATQREARRIGFVRPGEQLFVVKGIPEWRRAVRKLREHG
jgi:cell division protein FtsB